MPYSNQSYHFTTDYELIAIHFKKYQKLFWGLKTVKIPSPLMGEESKVRVKQDSPITPPLWIADQVRNDGAGPSFLRRRESTRVGNSHGCIWIGMDEVGCAAAGPGAASYWLQGSIHRVGDTVRRHSEPPLRLLR